MPLLRSVLVLRKQRRTPSMRRPLASSLSSSALAQRGTRRVRALTQMMTLQEAAAAAAAAEAAEAAAAEPGSAEEEEEAAPPTPAAAMLSAAAEAALLQADSSMLRQLTRC
jgi:hypothetical protein